MKTQRSIKNKKIDKETKKLVVVLSVIAFLCLSLWYIRNFYRVSDMTRVQSKEGIYELTSYDLDDELLHLEGNVLYLPGILTPEEFQKQEESAVSGNPQNRAYATSRIRILVPDDRIYMLTASSTDFAHRVYINGELRFEAGNPAETAEEFDPGYAQMTLEVRAVDGVIEIIQQNANFVHRGGGIHSDLYFGGKDIVQHMLALTFAPDYIMLGLFITLFLVHTVLYLVRRSYKPNLIFAVLCFTWMIRCGVTGTKVFYALIPSLPWELAFRAEYLSLPIAMALMILLMKELFPKVIQNWFLRTAIIGSSGFSILCVCLDTVPLSWILLGFESFFTLSILYLCVRFAKKIPNMIKQDEFHVEHIVSLIGFIVFMIASINDALYHSNAYRIMGFASSFPMTALAMLIFSFFQMTTMFYGTMRETALAHEREHQAKAEKEILSEMNRLKSAFYTDMSHEMKTPLTVIAVNAQFAAQNIKSGAIDEETITDLNAISTEARRMAQMVTSLVGIGRMQSSSEGQLLMTPMLKETTRIYQSLFNRKGNTLTLDTCELPPIKGNADQLIQVLVNLLSNANRHTTNGTVTIEAKIMHPMIQISVIDNGEGIQPELLPHVFERFFHGEKGGSGLGLAICKTFIEEHGGQIHIESEPEKGTCVWFTLPIKEVLENE